MMMNDDIVKLMVSILASLLHTIGFWALWNVKQSNPYMVTQRLYLLHLSLAENFHSFFLGLYYAFTLIGDHKWSNYAFICAGGGAFLWYLSIMIMLTIDRYLTVFLNIRYLLVWNVRRTKLVLAACFIVSIIANAVFLATLMSFDESLRIFSLYVWFPVDNGFIVIACVSYVYIIKTVLKRQPSKKYTTASKYTRETSSVVQHDVVNIDVQTESPQEIHRKTAKFPLKTLLIPFLLITTFVLFIGFPDNTYFWYFVFKQNVPKQLDTTFFIFYPTGIMSDAIIYVLCSQDVRAFLFKKICFKRQNKRYH